MFMCLAKSEEKRWESRGVCSLRKGGKDGVHRHADETRIQSIYINILSTINQWVVPKWSIALPKHTVIVSRNIVQNVTDDNIYINTTPDFWG